MNAARVSTAEAALTQAARPFAFVEADAAWRAALDRADHLRDQPETLTELWPQARVIVLDASGQALADDDGARGLLRSSE